MIRVENVSHAYGDNRVLDGVNLSVGKKKFIGVVGPNGSGKSTILKCIYRVLKQDTGTIWLDEKKLEEYKMSESARKMSVVSQHNYHSFDFMVEDMVLMGRSPYKKALERNTLEDYKIVNDALRAVDMEDFKYREYSSLSGGEQQRIILARALAQQPECLILDEPTNHLDIKHQLYLLDLIKKLNITVVSAIHDLNIALKYCDEVFVLKKGKIVDYGKTDEVITESLIKEVFEVDASITTVDGKRIIYFNNAI